jgi:hypothetical protein
MAYQNITNGWKYSFTASNTASIPVINIPSSVNTLLVVYSNVSIPSGAPFLQIQLSTNNGSSYISSGYFTGHNYTPYNSPILSNQSLTTGIQLGFQIGFPSISSGNCYLYGLNSSYAVTSTGSSCYNVSGTSYFGFTGGTLAGSTGINALQILASSGNITTGTFNIYGLN